MIVLLQWHVGAAQSWARLIIAFMTSAQSAAAPADNDPSEGKSLGTVPRSAAACGVRSSQRFIHDAADGPCAASALGAAPKAVIDLAGSTRRGFVARERRADVVVTEHVAGADDHCQKARVLSYC